MVLNAAARNVLVAIGIAILAPIMMKAMDFVGLTHSGEIYLQCRGEPDRMYSDRAACHAAEEKRPDQSACRCERRTEIRQMIGLAIVLLVPSILAAELFRASTLVSGLMLVASASIAAFVWIAFWPAPARPDVDHHAGEVRMLAAIVMAVLALIGYSAAYVLVVIVRHYWRRLRPRPG